MSMIPIKNPFVTLPGYSCFGCSPNNEYGLAMEFFEDGDSIVSFWNPKNHYSGFLGVLHGGIQATLHDEIASWVVFVKLKTAGYTADLSVAYKNPVLISKGTIKLVSKLVSQEGNFATMHTELFDGSGKLCSESHARYFIVPEHIAQKKFSYPGIDAFYKSR